VTAPDFGFRTYEETSMVRLNEDQSAGGMKRRQFLKTLGIGTAAFLTPLDVLANLVPVVSVNNPLDYYPNRDWEKVYVDQYRFDDTFTWICAPNDTHMCRLRAFVRNGVMIRAEQNYDNQRIGDLYGNRATQAWNPRACPKGYTFQRRVYGAHRLKGPVIRTGWKEWADAGFPSLSDHPGLRSKYRFDDRGNDTFTRVDWDEAWDYAAQGMLAVARTYSGEEGRARLEKDGYEPEMLEHWKGAGTRTMKIGSNLPIHGGQVPLLHEVVLRIDMPVVIPQRWVDSDVAHHLGPRPHQVRVVVAGFAIRVDNVPADQSHLSPWTGLENACGRFLLLAPRVADVSRAEETEFIVTDACIGVEEIVAPLHEHVTTSTEPVVIALSRCQTRQGNGV
jgi:hypothetical protein